MTRVLPRPRLASRLVGSTTLLLAPGGTGKTVLATQAGAGAAARLAWVRLDRSWRRGTDLAALLHRSLDAEPPSETEHFALAAHALDRLHETPTTLVVEALHHGVHETHTLLAEILSLVEEPTTVILTSRTRPVALMGRSASVLATVGQEELAFTHDEAAALFEAAGASAQDGRAWCERLSGWPTGLVLAAECGGGASRAVSQLVCEVLGVTEGEPIPDDVAALVALPYLTATAARSLGIGEDQLDALTERTVLIEGDRDVGWRLGSAARRALSDRVADEQRTAIRAAAAPTIAVEDPVTAFELYLAAGRQEDAAEVLAAATGRLGIDRTVQLVSRLDPRHQRALPPVLTAGRTPTDLHAAVAAGERRIREARDPLSTRAARIALGSVLINAAAPVRAAAVLEAALAQQVTALDASEDQLVRWHAAVLLGLARLNAGDHEGAGAALDEAGKNVWAWWVRGLLALARAEDDQACRIADRALRAAADDPAATDVPGLALRALSTARSDLDDARVAAADAYRAGIAAGGAERIIGAFVQGVISLRTQTVGVEGLATQIRAVARSGDHGAEALALVLEHHVTPEDAEVATRLRGLDARGANALIGIAARLLDDEEDLVEVQVLGGWGVSAGGRDLPRASWRSRKALEVLTVLAMAGRGGLRRAALVDRVWPDRPEDKGRALLRAALTAIRKSLEADRASPGRPAYLHADRQHVSLRGTTDLDRALLAARSGDPGAALTSLLRGAAADLPDTAWAEELRRVAARALLDVAAQVAADASHPMRVAALEALIDGEPWNRRHYDELQRHHRARGDDAAAEAVERRWFADDG